MGRLFGTDGIRGIANKELTSELALKVGKAVAYVINSNQNRRPRIVIGKDTRRSCDMLEGALIAGLCSVGADVITLGAISTPAVAFLVGEYKADAGIVISASHNSFEFNGIKVFGGDGYKLPDDLEEKIEDCVLNEELIKAETDGLMIGSVTNAKNAIGDYIDHIKSTVPFSLDGMRIAIDCANGAASFTAKRLFSELGAECFMLSDNPDGKNINLFCGSTDLTNLKKYVTENGMDAGIAFDGDADRCIAVDETGKAIDGDYIMGICATDMKSRGKLSKNAVVGTVMTNMGFSKFCEESGIRFYATKVGDKYVLEEMLLEGYNLGGEQSGHIIFLDFATTGDGQLTAAQLLCILKRRNARLSDLSHVFEKYPQVQTNVPADKETKLKFYTDQNVKQAIEKEKEALGDDGRIVVRVSGTEPVIRIMAEGKDKELIQNSVNNIQRVINSSLLGRA